MVPAPNLVEQAVVFALFVSSSIALSLCVAA